MGEVRRHCCVGLPALVLWRHLADYENVVRMAAGGTARLVSGRPEVPGARYHASLSWEGIESSFETVLTEASPPTALKWYGSEAGIEMRVRFDLEACGAASTELTATLVTTMGAATLPLEPFASALAARMLDRLLRALQAIEPAAAS